MGGETGNMPFYILDNSKYCDSSCEIRNGEKHILDDSLDANVPTVPYGGTVDNLEDAIDKCIKNPNCSQMVINTKTNKVYPMSKITNVDPNKYVRRQYNADITQVTILQPPDPPGKLIKIENPSDNYIIKAGDYISFNQILKYDSDTKELPANTQLTIINSYNRVDNTINLKNELLYKNNVIDLSSQENIINASKDLYK